MPTPMIPLQASIQVVRASWYQPAPLDPSCPSHSQPGSDSSLPPAGISAHCSPRANLAGGSAGPCFLQWFISFAEIRPLPSAFT